VDAETQRYVDSELRAAKAETNLGFARVEAKIDALPRAPSLWQIASVVAGGIGIAVAIAAFASDRFDGGLSAIAVVDGVVERISAEQERRDAEQDQRLERLLRAVEARPSDPISSGDGASE